MKHTKPLPSLGRLRELFRYCPVSGFLYNNQRRTGYVTSKNNRYRTCFVDGKLYPQHRVAWKLMKGEDPPSEIDHEDRDGFNNKWSNLRLTDRSGNCLNTATRKDNVLGERGIHVHKPSGKFILQMQRNKQRMRAYFSTLEEAVELRDFINQESK